MDQFKTYPIYPNYSDLTQPGSPNVRVVDVVGEPPQRMALFQENLGW